MKSKFIVAFALLLVPFAAQAGGAHTPLAFLKAEATVEADVVRIGDLIEHAGPAAEVAAFRAPELGGVGTVQTHRVIEAAREHGILIFDTRGLSAVTVKRNARTIGFAELETAVVEAAMRELGLGDAAGVTVQLDRDMRPLHIEPGVTDAARIVHFSYEPRTRRFSGRVEVAGSNVLRLHAALVSGTLQETAQVVTLARPVARGETVRAGDIVIERRARSEIAADAVVRPEAAVGLAARRALRADQVLRPADLMKPDFVTRNEMVTILFESGGIRLSARGKALDAGAEGDTVNVLNPQSKRTLQAIVEAPGLVVVNRHTAAATAATGGTR